MSRTGTIFVGSALALVAGMLVSEAAPKGRVVRVDRVRPPASLPRMCMMGVEDRMICIGKPDVDEVIQIFENAKGKIVGAIRIDTVKDFMGFRVCPGKNAVVYEVTGTVVVGPPDLLDNSRTVVGLRQAELDSGSRLVKNLTPPSDADPKVKGTRQVEMAVDRDGDGTADFVMEHYTCPDPRSTSRTPATCFDTYIERRGKLEFVHRDTIQVCS